MKKQLLIAGGTGMIGTALAHEAASRGWEVTILSRTPSPGRIGWDPGRQTIDLDHPRSFDVVVNLAGALISGKRWTGKRQQEIMDSRTQASRTLEKYLAAGTIRTQLYIGASAVGIYGDRAEEKISDTSAVSSSGDWMVRTVKAWEEGHRRIADLGIRTVIFRISPVLSHKGGALKEIVQTAPFGVVGYFGSGRQLWSWIHIDDLVRVFMHAMDHQKTVGTYLVCAPNPVSNKEFAHAVASQFSPRRMVLSVPVFALKIMLGKMHQMLLDSFHGYPARLLSEGFSFTYPFVDEALRQLLRR